MRILVALLGAAALMACGGHQQPATAGKPSAGAGPVSIRPQPQPPFVTPGERMTFKASIHGLEMATFGIAVGEVTDWKGKPAVVVQAGVQSSQMLSILKKIDDTFSTWIDTGTGRPLFFRGHELSGLADPVIEDTDVDFGTAATGKVQVDLTRVDTGKTVEMQEQTTADLMDFQAFFLALRAWDAPVGSTLSADVLRSRFMWRTELKVGAFENLTTELGQLPAVRFDGVAQRLTRAGAIDKDSDERHYQIWVSDDADRVPLRLVAKTDYGDIEMEIIDYAAGKGARLGQVWTAPAAPAAAATR
jgi:hypothetical protein